MIESQIAIRQVRELSEAVKASVCRDFKPGSITIVLPEYLPPVVLTIAAEQRTLLAARAVAKCATAGDALLISAHYEDRHEISTCCVVLALQLRSTGREDGFAVENTWLEEIGRLSQELLTHSVDLSLHAEGGSCNFELRIPVHHSCAKAVVHRNAILLVEDETFVRHATREVLDMAGYLVVEAANAEEALITFERKRHTLCAVLSDVTMPGRDGLELANLLHASAPGLPILLMSGYGNSVVEDIPNRVYYLPKPYNSEALLKALQRCLRVHHRPVEVRGGAHVEASLLGAAEESVPFSGAREV
jgi:two-component system, response regulator PdtaR